jgi:hypothetical protein
MPPYLNEYPNSAAIGPLRPSSSSSALRTKEANKAVFLNFGPYSFGPNFSFRDWLDNPSKRTAAMKKSCEGGRDRDFFIRLRSEEMEVGDVSCLYRLEFTTILIIMAQKKTT